MDEGQNDDENQDFHRTILADDNYFMKLFLFFASSKKPFTQTSKMLAHCICTATAIFPFVYLSSNNASKTCSRRIINSSSIKRCIDILEILTYLHRHSTAALAQFDALSPCPQNFKYFLQIASST